MNNVDVITKELSRRGYVKLKGRNTWKKGSWTIRFDDTDIEIFDSPDRTGKYLLDNVRTIDVIPILEDIEKLYK